MPNHITNILHADPEVLKALMPAPASTTSKEAASDSQGSEEKLIVDFNLIVPLRDDDPRVTVPKVDFGGGLFGYPLSFGGGISMLDLQISCWGTKWNAYDEDISKVDQGILRFDTAWSHPAPVLRALSCRFPQHRVRVQYADEDIGANFGDYVLLNGEKVEEVKFTKATGLDFGCQMKHGMTYKEYRRKYLEEEDSDDEKEEE